MSGLWSGIKKVLSVLTDLLNVGRNAGLWSIKLLGFKPRVRDPREGR